MGGNSALIVLEDADIDAVISTAAWGSFFHQGQICMTTGRHLVHASLYEEFVERLAAKADSLAVGDPHREQVHLGPIIDSAQLAKVQGLVESGARRAARSSRPVARIEALLPSDGPRGSRRRDARVRRGGLRPGGARTIVRGRRRGRGPRRRRTLRPLTGHRHPGHRARPGPGRAHPDRDERINDQTVNDEAVARLGDTTSSREYRFGGEANLEAFTDVRWTTVRGRWRIPF